MVLLKGAKMKFGTERREHVASGGRLEGDVLHGGCARDREKDQGIPESEVRY
jgi:hypothetical protein